MPSVRLSNDIRASILTDILTHAFHDKVKKSMDRQIAFVQKVWDQALGKNKKILEEAPEGFFGTSKMYRIILDNEHDFFSFEQGFDYYGYRDARWWSQTGYKFESVKPIRMPSEVMKQQPLMQVDKGDALYAEYRAIEDERSALADSIAKMRTDANAILQSCSSTSKLKTVWPEITTFVEPYEAPKEKKNLPAVNVEPLNEALGLPPETKEAA